MSRLSEVINTPLSQIKRVLPPVGFYHAQLASGSIGDEKEDKNGKVYRRASLTVKLERPNGDMSAEAAEEFERMLEDGEVNAVFWSKLIYGANDTASTASMLARVGVDLPEGSTLKDVFEGIKGAGGYACQVQIKHREYRGEMDAEVVTILPEEDA